MKQSFIEKLPDYEFLNYEAKYQEGYNSVIDSTFLTVYATLSRLELLYTLSKDFANNGKNAWFQGRADALCKLIQGLKVVVA